MTYRKYQDGDEPKILALYRETFDQLIEPEYWRWKYLRNPSGKVYAYLAFDQDRCVGQYAMLPMSLCDHGREVDTLVALDNMVHPDYQRRGILKQLEDLLVKERPTNIPYYTFLNENSFEVYTKKFGWKYMGELGVYMKPTGLASLVRRHKLWHIAQPAMWAYQYFYNNSRNPVRAESFTAFDDEIDAVWQRNKDKVGVTFNRSRPYLHWRYDQSPISYHKYKILAGTELVGYVVVRIQEKFGFAIGWVLDIWLDQTRDSDVYRDALLVVQDQLGKQCDFLSVLLPAAKYHRPIGKAGFKKVPKEVLPHEFYFCVRQNDFPHAEVLDIDNWYLSWSLHDTL